MMQSTIKWTLLAAVALLALLAAATQVFAHAGYESSVPGRDEVGAEAPAQVDVFFTQDVKKVTGRYFVRVYEGSGAVNAGFCETADAMQVSNGDGNVDDDDRTHISTTFQPELAVLAEVRYVVCWMTTSDLDDDDDSGAFCFYVGAEPAVEQAAECAAFNEAEAPTSTAASQPTEPPAGETATAPPPADTTPTAVAPDADGSDDDGGVSAGLVIGIIAGIVAIVVVAGGAAVWLRRT